MSGKKSAKYQCFVLCLRRYIPRHPPTPPKRPVNRNSLFSVPVGKVEFVYYLFCSIIGKFLAFICCFHTASLNARKGYAICAVVFKRGIF